MKIFSKYSVYKTFLIICIVYMTAIVFESNYRKNVPSMIFGNCIRRVLKIKRQVPWNGSRDTSAPGHFGTKL